MNKQDAFEMAVIELLGQEALLEEKISIYKTASMFWNAACDWQKQRDAQLCEDVEEPNWYGYENPYSFDDGARACLEAILKE